MARVKIHMENWLRDQAGEFGKSQEGIYMPCIRVCLESNGKPHFRKITRNDVVMRNFECLHCSNSTMSRRKVEVAYHRDQLNEEG